MGISSANKRIEFVPPPIPQRVGGLTEVQYEWIRTKLLSLTGIELGESKQTLAESRLLKRLSALGLKEYSDYLNYLKKNESENTFFINCLTTNKTDWFRENSHFDHLVKAVLPRIGSQVMVWSAASSTGEEIYTLAMVLKEYYQGRGDFKILGTDIDTDALKKASSGIYRAETVKEQVPAEYLRKYFTLSNDKETCTVKPELRKNVKFRQFNLISGSLPGGLMFDVIFLRNVLIYFKGNTIENVIGRLVTYLKPGGHLFIGHSESLTGIKHPLVLTSNAVYKLPAG